MSDVVDQSTESRKFQAFISYARAGNRLFVRRIRWEIRRMGRRYSDPYKKQIYLDTHSSEIADSGWQHLKEALDNSEFFVFIATPEAKHREWVNKEIAHFAATERALSDERLIVVLARGELRWDKEAQTFEDTSSCAPALREWAAARDSSDEPFWLDMRKSPGWRRRRTEANDPHLQMAKLVAKVRNDKRETPLAILGEDARVMRQRNWVVSLAALSIIAFAILASLYWRSAVENERERRSEAVSALARAGASENPDAALLLASAAAATDTTDGSYRGLLDVLGNSTGLETYLHPEIGAIRSAALVNKDTLLVASDDGLIARLDLASGQVVRQAQLGVDSVREILVEDQEVALLAAEAEGEDSGVLVRVRIDDLTTVGRVALNAPVRSMAIAGDRLFAGLDDGGGVIELQRTSLQLVSQLLAFDRVNSLAVSSDNRLLAVGGRRTTLRNKNPLVLVDLGTNEILAEASDPADAASGSTPCDEYCLTTVMSVVFDAADPDRVIFGTLAGTVGVWDSEDDPNAAGSHPAQVARVRVSADGSHVLSSGFDGSVRVWDAETFNPIGPMRFPHGAPTWDVVANGETMFSTSGDGTIAVAAVKSFIPPHASHVLASTIPAINDLAVLPTGQDSWMVAADRGNQVFIFDQDNNVVDGIGDISSRVIAIRPCEPCTGFLIGLASGEIMKWSADNGATVVANADLVASAMAVHPTRQQVVVAGQLPDAGYGIVVVDLEAGDDDHRRVALKDDDLLDPRSLSFTSDGNRLIVGGLGVRHTVRSWPDLEILTNGSESNDWVIGTATSRQGRVALGTNSQKLVVLEPDGQHVTFSGTDDVVWSAAFSPDDRFVASGGGDAGVRLWDLQASDRQFADPLRGHTDDVRALAFSPNGDRLYSLSPSEVLVWDLDIDSLQKHACSTANRPFDIGEWTASTGLSVDDLPSKPCDPAEASSGRPWLLGLATLPAASAVAALYRFLRMRSR